MRRTSVPVVHPEGRVADGEHRDAGDVERATRSSRGVDLDEAALADRPRACAARRRHADAFHQLAGGERLGCRVDRADPGRTADPERRRGATERPTVRAAHEGRGRERGGGGGGRWRRKEPGSGTARDHQRTGDEQHDGDEWRRAAADARRADAVPRAATRLPGRPGCGRTCPRASGWARASDPRRRTPRRGGAASRRASRAASRRPPFAGGAGPAVVGLDRGPHALDGVAQPGLDRAERDRRVDSAISAWVRPRWWWRTSTARCSTGKPAEPSIDAVAVGERRVRDRRRRCPGRAASGRRPGAGRRLRASS